MTYTKNELVTELSAKLNVSAEQAKVMAGAFFDCLADAFKKVDKVAFRGFGVFHVKMRKARVGRNPRQPEVLVQVPAKKVVRFKLGKELDGLLNP